MVCVKGLTSLFCMDYPVVPVLSVEETLLSLVENLLALDG